MRGKVQEIVTGRSPSCLGRTCDHPAKAPAQFFAASNVSQGPLRAGAASIARSDDLTPLKERMSMRENALSYLSSYRRSGEKQSMQSEEGLSSYSVGNGLLRGILVDCSLVKELQES